jgi:hypothetical protein
MIPEVNASAMRAGNLRSAGRPQNFAEFSQPGNAVHQRP